MPSSYDLAICPECGLRFWDDAAFSRHMYDCQEALSD